MIIDRLKEGDVIYTNCVDMHLCYHIGIVYSYNGKKKVFHNAPNNKNKYGGTVCSESFENFIKNRQLDRIVRTNASNEDILRISRECREEVWDTFFFNCEDYVLQITEGHRRSNLRDAWKIAALGMLFIAL